MINWCCKCNGSGKIRAFDSHWWQFFAKGQECPDCKGTGIKPPQLSRPPRPMSGSGPPVKSESTQEIFRENWLNSSNTTDKILRDYIKRMLLKLNNEDFMEWIEDFVNYEA